MTELLHTIDQYVEKCYPENKRVRPRLAKDEVWQKDVPSNPISWAIKKGYEDDQYNSGLGNLGNRNIIM